MSEKRYAVLIASSRFPEEPKLQDLRCPENDAQGLNEILASEEYGAFHETLVLPNKESYKVLRKINKVLKKASKDDLVLIYYSGHGKLDDNGRLHLATIDTEVPELEATSVPTERIHSFISNSLCTKLVMILDCCYAGAVAKDFFKSDLDGQLQVLSRRGRGIYILTASTETQVAKEKATDKYSLMTKHIIGGIKGGEVEANEKGLVSVDRLYNYVHDKVVQEDHQEPTRFGRDVRGELFIARSGKTPRAKRNRQIRKLLYELAAQDKLPDDILDKARGVIALEQTKLIGPLRTYDDLLEKLRQNQIGVWQFIREWYKVGAKATPQIIEPPPKEPEEAKPVVAKPKPTEPPPPKAKPAEPVKKGKLFVRTDPRDATVKIPNIRAKFAQGMELEPGGYHLEVSADGHQTKRRRIELRAEEKKRVSFKLKAIEAVPLQPETEIADSFTNSLGMKFVLIPAGTFMMGSPPEEINRYDDEDQHKVTISRPFYLQTTQVTQGQWKSLMGDNPSDYEDCGDSCPVENVSWGDARQFISKLNQKENTNKYRLPREAEWEYACRAASTTRFCFGDSENRVREYAWYNANSKNKTNPVGRKKTNAWSLYDMHGNVWEWCQDWYGDYPSGHVTDPKGPSRPKRFSRQLRVLRGGSWLSGTRDVRSAGRSWHDPDSRGNLIGFRVARAP